MKKKNVPKEERETIVLFNEADDIATIYTFNGGLKKRLVSFAEKHPDLCRMTVDDAVYGSVTYEIQKSRVSIRLMEPYSEVRRKAASEYAKANGIGIKNSKLNQVGNRGMLEADDISNIGENKYGST